MEWQHAWRESIYPDLRSRRNPAKVIMGYAASRGMSFWTDVRDWLGGYPMEFAGNEETKRFCRDKLGLELINISAGEGNTEFLFRHQNARNYWDDVRASISLITLDGPFAHRKGAAYEMSLPAYADTSDDLQNPRRSRLMLYEDAEPIGWAHQPVADIEKHGAGRYSHWQRITYFFFHRWHGSQHQWSPIRDRGFGFALVEAIAIVRASYQRLARLQQSHLPYLNDS